MSLTTFYHRKKIFLTGHTGFKGSWLAAWLKRLGANVTGYALAPEPNRPSLFAAARIDRGTRSIIGDLRDAAALSAAIADAQPEIVFHLAAQPLVRRSYAAPVETLHVNVLGTAHLLEAVRHTSSVRAVVVVTSDKCYENREWPWGYREDEPLGGRDPYSCSKACAELIADAYRQSYFMSAVAPRLATVRAGNVFGGGDWSADRLVPDILRALLAGEKVVLRNPRAVRPWQHVLEPLCGYLEVGRRLCRDGEPFCGAWNFGPADDDAISVHELTERIVRIWGGGRIVLEQPANAPHEAHTLRLDSSKARSRLGWRPRLSLDEALRWTVDWTRAWAKSPAVAEHALNQQVANYMERSASVRCAA